MDTPSLEDIIRALEDCVLLQGTEADAAWERMVEWVNGIAEPIAGKLVRPGETEEFLDWLPGWLLEEGKLECLWKALTEKQESGDLKDAADTRSFLDSYLTQVLKSGAGDFRRNQMLWRAQGEKDEAGRRRVTVISMDASDQGTEACDPRPGMAGQAKTLAQLNNIRDGLEPLEPAARIPFVLRFYRELGPLSHADCHWLAEQTGRKADQIRAAADREHGLCCHPNRTYTLSYEFIGDLMGCDPDARGTFNAIEQRVRRVMLLLAARLQGED